MIRLAGVICALMIILYGVAEGSHHRIIPLERITAMQSLVEFEKLPELHEKTTLDAFYQMSNQSIQALRPEMEKLEQEYHTYPRLPSWDLDIWHEVEDEPLFLPLLRGHTTIDAVSPLTKGKEQRSWTLTWSRPSGQLLIKFFFVDSIGDVLRFSRDSYTHYLLDHLEPQLLFGEFARPVKKWRCDSCHPIGKAIVESHIVWAGGSVLEWANHVISGKMRNEAFNAIFERVGSAMGELHMITSSLRDGPTPLSPWAYHSGKNGERATIHALWTEGRVRMVLEGISVFFEHEDKAIDIDAFVAKTMQLAVAEQPSTSLIHGDPVLDHILVKGHIFSGQQMGAIRWLSLSAVGSYLFYPIEDGTTPQQWERMAIDKTPPLVGGAPELDYAVFVHDVAFRLTALSFEEDEIESALQPFTRAYCSMYHNHFAGEGDGRGDVTCQFPSQPFVEYADWLGRLVVSQNDYQAFEYFFPSYVVDKIE